MVNSTYDKSTAAPANSTLVPHVLLVALVSSGNTLSRNNRVSFAPRLKDNHEHCFIPHNILIFENLQITLQWKHSAFVLPAFAQDVADTSTKFRRLHHISHKDVSTAIRTHCGHYLFVPLKCTEQRLYSTFLRSCLANRRQDLPHVKGLAQHFHHERNCGKQKG